MMKKTFSQFLVILSFVFCSWPAFAHFFDGRELFDVPKREPLNRNTLQGYWSSPDNFNGDVQESYRYKIENNMLTAAVRCEGFFSTEPTYVSVQVPIRVTENTIEIIYGDSESRRADDFICSVAVAQTPPLRYRIINGFLYFNAFSDPLEKLSDL